jgi:hypothetical protein
MVSPNFPILVDWNISFCSARRWLNPPRCFLERFLPCISVPLSWTCRQTNVSSYTTNGSLDIWTSTTIIDPDPWQSYLNPWNRTWSTTKFVLLQMQSVLVGIPKIHLSVRSLSSFWERPTCSSVLSIQPYFSWVFPSVV